MLNLFYRRAGDGPDGFNFERQSLTLAQTLERIDRSAREPEAPSVYMGSLPADDYAPGFAVANALRWFQPVLLGLSASSPFLDGRDSGLASARSMTFSRSFPRGNVMPAAGRVFVTRNVATRLERSSRGFWRAE